MAGPLSKTGKMIQDLKKSRERRERALQLQKPSKLPLKSALNKAGYINENGLDRQDAQLLRNNPRAFQNKADNLVRKNEGKGMQQGIVYKENPLMRAEQRSAKNKKKK